jgi:hypothetical protein
LMERLQLCVSQSRKTKGFNMFLMVLLFTCWWSKLHLMLKDLGF